MSGPGDTEQPPSYSGYCSCCSSCFRFCGSREDKKKFAGVEYELVPSSGEAEIFTNLPMPDVQKRYVLPQGKTEYAVPLELKKREGFKRVVTIQPKRIRSISEPAMPPSYTPSEKVLDLRRTGSVSSASILSESSSLSSSSSPYPLYSDGQTTAHPSFTPLDEPCTWKPSLSSIAEGGEGNREGRSSPAEPPEIEFSLYYDIQCRTLTVHLQCAWNLPRKGKKGTPNPIVLLYLLPNREDIFHSKMIENASNPMFNQSFEFKGLLPDEVRRQTLVFRIFSQSSKGDLLGGLGLSLAEADLFGMMCRKNIDTDMEKLKLVSKGDLLISLTYNPVAKRLNGLLLKATNLQKQDIVGLADPYVKIWLLKKGRRNQKWKSKVKRNTLIPVFNESFQFDLSEINVKEVALEIFMMDYDRFSRNDVVGVVYIGEQVLHDTGRQHWEQMVSQPNTSISSWHTIQPITSETDRTTKRRRVSRTLSACYDDD